MARTPRIVIPGLAHHVTQRGSRRQNVFFCDEDRVLYLDPPYNDREYSAYYHLPETLVLWDSPEIHGKSGIRTNRCVRRSKATSD